MEFSIMSVETADIQILKSDPPRIAVEALGTVNSGGWSNGRLVPAVYIVPPSDGMQDFQFIATGPEGIVTMGTVKNFVGSGWVPQFDWLKGVRIHSSTNSIEVMLDQSLHSAAADSAQVLDGEHWPFPL